MSNIKKRQSSFDEELNKLEQQVLQEINYSPSPQDKTHEPVEIWDKPFPNDEEFNPKLIKELNYEPPEINLTPESL